MDQPTIVTAVFLISVAVLTGRWIIAALRVPAPPADGLSRPGDT
jgi:hypothetical protein